MKRALVLVEGQTEEQFVKIVLGPYLLTVDLAISPKILTTKRVKDGADFKGGVTTFDKFRGDVRRLLMGVGDGLVTTMVDYYGLPSDFPGLSTRPRSDARERVEHVELAIAQDFNDNRLIPFLMLHEFETLLFSSSVELPRTMNATNETARFAAIRSGFKTPEDINDGATTAPSKRILGLYPGYQKVVDGVNTVKRIGIEGIRSECPHFAGWLKRLEDFAKT